MMTAMSISDPEGPTCVNTLVAADEIELDGIEIDDITLDEIGLDEIELEAVVNVTEGTELRVMGTDMVLLGVETSKR